MMKPFLRALMMTVTLALAAAPALAEITLDCVAGGASIGFMADVTHAQVLRFWRQVATAARSDGRAVIVAERDGAVLGVVQMIPTRIDNQPHRGEVAKMLVNAEHPVIYADRVARTPEGLKLLVELAETLQAPVCDSTNRFNFPWRHPLNQSRRQRQLMNQADVPQQAIDALQDILVRYPDLAAVQTLINALKLFQ